MNSKNIVWQKFKIKKEDREKIHRHKSAVLWFTGLSGSGKSTIANALEIYLNKINISTYILDGDNIRYGLCNDLDFKTKNRKENIRRVAEISKIIIDAGILLLVTLVSPYVEDRLIARKIIKTNNFFEVFVDTPLKVCESRDIKGLYKKARLGKINNFTGIQSKYDIPLKSEIHLDGEKPINTLVDKLIKFLNNKKILNI